jgi:hypothetical protein
MPPMHQKYILINTQGLIADTLEMSEEEFVEANRLYCLLTDGEWQWIQLQHHSPLVPAFISVASICC